MIYVTMYLGAIVAANLLIARFGPSAAIMIAFVFVGFDLVARDKLHEAWRGSGLAWKMTALIATGSILSWVLNREAGQIAVASFVAFACAAVADAIVYAVGLRAKWSWLQRSNVSNVAGAAVDSLLFPTLAFGGFMPVVTLGQFAAKVFGGAVWSFVLRKRLA